MELTKLGREILRTGKIGKRIRLQIANNHNISERQVQNWVRDGDDRLFEPETIELIKKGTQMGVKKLFKNGASAKG